MTSIQIELPRLHPKQIEVLNGRKRFNVACMGRRFGKTTLGIDWLLSSERGSLEGNPVGWFAPTYKLLDDVWRDCVSILRPLIKQKDVQQKRIELLTGGIVDFWHLQDDDPARGKKYAQVVIDEAAMVPRMLKKWQEAIRPTLTDYAGDAFFFSTPKGRNDFFKLFQRHEEDPDRWAAFSMPTSANPYIEASEIQAAKDELPERVFSQEYLAEFLVDGGGVFRNVQECATLKTQEYRRNKTYSIGVDWGKYNDFTVIVVMDRDTRQMAAIDRFNRIDYHVQTQRLKAIWERYGKPVITAESNSMGDVVIEILRRDRMPVVPFNTTNASKRDIIDNLAIAFERKKINIINDRVLLDELLSYTMERTKSGQLRYGAPDGGHDDCVIGLALSYHSACAGHGQIASAGSRIF